MADARQDGITARLRWLHQPFYGVRSHASCADLPSRAAALQSRCVKEVDGIRLTCPIDAWLDLAPVLTLDDLVILGDAILARNRALIADLRSGIERRRGQRGIKRAREAVELIRSGVRSPMETVTRLVLMRGGLPAPEVNAEVTDAAHTWIAEADLVWRDRKVIVEYDGLWHSEPGQRRLDAVRRRQLRAEGWIVIELYADDVLRREENTCRWFGKRLPAGWRHDRHLKIAHLARGPRRGGAEGQCAAHLPAVLATSATVTRQSRDLAPASHLGLDRTVRVGDPVRPGPDIHSRLRADL